MKPSLTKKMYLVFEHHFISNKMILLVNFSSLRFPYFFYLKHLRKYQMFIALKLHQHLSPAQKDIVSFNLLTTLNQLN